MSSIKRRKFINTLLGFSITGWFASVFYPVISYLKPPKKSEELVGAVKAGKTSEFPVNTGKIVRYGRKPVIVIHLENGEFRAMEATCTHLGCIVQYRDDKKQIWCACHNGLYDLSGRNIAGPPPRPLQLMQVRIVEDELIISPSKQLG